MSKKVKILIYGITAFFTVSIIIICIHNIGNNEQFFSINVFNGITMLWTVGLTFVLTQGFNHYQRKTDVMIKIMQGLLDNIDEYKTCNFTENFKTEDILMRNRQIRQRIQLLKKYSEKYGIKDEIYFIEDKFSEYDLIISEHISDVEYLVKMRSNLERPIKLIQERIYQAMLKI